MNIKPLAYVVMVTSALLLFSPQSFAQTNTNNTTVKRCPAGNTGCTTDNAFKKMKKAITDGVETVGSNQGNNKKSMRKRVRGVKKTLEYCVDCAMDAVGDAGDKITGKKPDSDKD